MKTLKTVVLGLGLASSVLFTSVPARAFQAPPLAFGEDWPFFCRLDSEGEQEFRIVSDVASETGFTLVMYYQGEKDGEMDAHIKLTDDGKHYEIYGLEHLGPFRDRQILAYVNKASDEGSFGDVRTTVRPLPGFRTPTYFYLDPIECRPNVEE